MVGVLALVGMLALPSSAPAPTLAQQVRGTRRLVVWERVPSSPGDR